MQVSGLVGKIGGLDNISQKTPVKNGGKTRINKALAYFRYAGRDAKSFVSTNLRVREDPIQMIAASAAL